MRLESRARDTGLSLPDFAVTAAGLDPAPLWPAVLDARQAGADPGALAHAFHKSLARAFAAPARALVAAGRARAVALSGGCFQNALLLRLTLRELDGLPVLTHRMTPANDGGLALGQAMVALARAPAAPRAPGR